MSEHNAAPMRPWIPVQGGFLCDGTGSGQFEIRDQVAYWVSDDQEFVLDLTEEAISEAARRNQRAAAARTTTRVPAREAHTEGTDTRDRPAPREATHTPEGEQS